MGKINKPEINIVIENSFSSQDFITDINSLKEHGINIKITKRESIIYNAIEWTIPTLIVVYVLKPYFESFLKEAGKNHYKILSKKLQHFFAKLYHSKDDSESESNTQIKAKKAYSQSKYISLVFEIPNGRLITLLFDTDLGKTDWENAIDQFFVYIIEHYDNPTSNRLDDLTSSYEKSVKHNYYAIINKESKKIEFFDDRKLVLLSINKS